MSEPDLNQSVIYLAYGDVMHQFQVFELTLWQFLSRTLKPGTTFEQGMEKVDRWNGTTLGALVRGLKTQDHWPDGVPEALETAVETRNFLAHYYLREYFLVLPSERILDEALTELAELREWIIQLEGQLEQHLQSLGIPTSAELTDEERSGFEGLRPTTWHRNL